MKQAIRTRFDKTGQSISDFARVVAPLIFLLVLYVSFRFISAELSERTHYTFMPHFDKLLFGVLPTITLQHWLWHGSVTWYDDLFYGVYTMHYLLPVLLVALVYRFRRTEYWQLISAYVIATLTAFLAFILYPAAPPWLASQDGYIPHIARIPDAVYASVGIHNYAALYGHYAPNPIAAVPSLHTTFAVLFALFVYRLCGWRWFAVSLIYPLCIVFGVIYMGEHYFFDVAAGTVLASASFALTPVLFRESSVNLYIRFLKASRAMMAGIGSRN